MYQWSKPTLLCTPDDGCKSHPKYVEWICSEIKNIDCALLHFVGYLYIWTLKYNNQPSVGGSTDNSRNFCTVSTLQETDFVLHNIRRMNKTLLQTLATDWSAAAVYCFGIDNSYKRRTQKHVDHLDLFVHYFNICLNWTRRPTWIPIWQTSL